ncbi:GTPase [Actinomyces oricola]
MTHPNLAPVSSEVLDAAHLDARLAQIRAALDACPTEVPASLAYPARVSLDEVAERLALGVDHTVVALFGGTGSGKSSLFNALSQLQFADVGARRPTTSRAAACTWGDDANALLDFLGVSDQRRIRRESLLDASDQDELAGLVLLDVPDYDSVSTEHALQVDRLVPMADVLVWVVDPQKYADAALHEGYLRGLGARQEDMLLLVNQIDTLPASAVDTLMADARSLLDRDGLTEVKVLAVSATRGDNVKDVRNMLCQRVARASNAARTASAELDAIALRLRSTVAPKPVNVNPEFAETSTTSLVQASGAHAVAASVRSSLSHVFARALARPEPPSRAAVEAVRTTWMRRTTDGLPPAWLRSIDREVASPEALGAQTAEAVGSVPFPGHRSPVLDLAWWGGVLAMVVGLVCGVYFFLRGGPLLLAVALVGVGVLLAVVALVLRRKWAKRESENYLTQVNARVKAVVERGVSEPADEVLGRHRLLQSALGL